MYEQLDYLCPLPHIECLRFDGNFQITHTSSGCGRFLEDETLIERGNSILDALPELFGLEELILDIIDGRQPSFELKAISRQHSDGTLRYYDLYVIADLDCYTNRDQKSKFATVFLEDVTHILSFMQTLTQASNEMTLLLDQLQETNQKLTRATRLKDEFLANMSSESQTPLNEILGISEGQQEEVFGIVNIQQLKALETIEYSGSHLLELINDILDIAKIESGQVKLNCDPTAVVPLCESSLNFIEQQALKKQIHIETKLPENLPHLFVDKQRIRKVLINLLNNAIQFTPEGGKITLEVTFPLPPEESLDVKNPLQIAIIDTGSGIDPEDLKQLFRPFAQVDRSSNCQAHTIGLGLFLVKRIIQLHRGEVGVSSELGVGSRFTITLPCVASASSLAELRTSLNLNVHQPQQQTTKVILLVEDNAANISTISSYLRAKSYCLLVVKTTEEATTLAQSQTPNVIVINLQISGINGVNGIKHIRQTSSLVHTPIIALTTLEVRGDRERCLEAGANDYLRRPVKLKNLLNSIEQFL